MRMRNARYLLFLHILSFTFLFAPFLGGNLLLGGQGDAVLFDYPLMQLFAERAFTFDLLWNDLNFHGFPTFLGQAYPLHPFLGIFTLIVNPVAALNWTIALYPLLGAFFFSILMQREGVSPFGSFIAGIAYAVAMRSWFFDITITGFLPLFPLLLLSIRNATKNLPSHALRIRWTSLLFGSAVIALAWLTLHFHFTLILLMGAGLYCIVHALRNRTGAWLILLLFGGMVLFGTAIGLLRLLPTLAYGLFSFRTEMPLSYVTDRGIGTRYPLLYLFPHFPFPFLSGGADFSPYVGSLILACIIIGIAHHWHEKRVLFLLSIYVITCIMAIRHSPLYALLYHIPPFNVLRAPTRWPLLGTFAMAALAGMGFDALLRENTSRMRRMLSRVAIGVGAAAIGAGTAASLLPSLLSLFPSLAGGIFSVVSAVHPSAGSLEAGHIVSIIARTYGIQSAELLLPAVALVLAGVILHSYAWNRFGLAKRPVVFALSAAFTLFIVIFPAQLKASKSVATYLTPTDVQQFLAQNGGLFLTFLSSDAMRSSLQMGAYKASLREIQRAELSFLPANMNLFQMLPTADYYDRLGSKRMGRLLALVGTDRPSVAPEETLAMRPLNIEQKMEELRKRRYILDILNVRHIISGWPLEAVGFAKEFTEEVTDGRIPVSVYGNPSARPFAYFAKRVEFMEPDA
ncbi:hypothetical protein HY464_00775, partial [Candidatus Peregrinibacteria bacterium]|nr:hypothetical protein [Candidatus Peregrinibacteria bacterium]